MACRGPTKSSCLTSPRIKSTDIFRRQKTLESRPGRNSRAAGLPGAHGLAGFVAELTAELNDIDAMLGRLSRTQKNHGHVVIIPGAKLRVFVDIDFREACAKFLEQWCDLRFCFFAKMASGTRIDRNVARPRE